jgi:pSer/pThr/pTyr-binding forkhead associated (FHA) protein/uncharacterized coiled-coil DUF342 family protein
MAYLEIRKQDRRRVRRLDLDDAPLTIGAHASNRLVLSDAAIDPHHCVVQTIEGASWIHDLGSAAGMLVNLQREHRHLLRHGDRIRIGPYILSFVEKQPASEIATDRPDLAGVCDAEAEPTAAPRRSRVSGDGPMPAAGLPGPERPVGPETTRRGPSAGVDDMSEQLARSEAERHVVESEALELRGMLEQLQERCRNLETQIDRARHDREAIVMQLDEAHALRAEAERQVEALRSDRADLDLAREELDRAYASMRQLQTRLDRATASRQTMTVQADTAEERLLAAEDRLSQLYQERDEAQAQLEQTRAERDAARAQVSSIEADLEGAAHDAAAAARLADELATLRAERDAMSRELEDARRGRAEAEAEASRVRRHESDHDSTARRLRRERDAALSRIAPLEEAIEEACQMRLSAERQAEESLGEQQSVAARYAKLQEDHETLQREMLELEERRVESDAGRQDAEHRANALATARSTMQEELDRLRELQAGTSEEAESLQDELDETHLAHRETKAEARRAAQRIVELERHVTELDEAREQWRAERAALQTQLRHARTHSRQDQPRATEPTRRGEQSRNVVKAAESKTGGSGSQLTAVAAPAAAAETRSAPTSGASTTTADAPVRETQRGRRKVARPLGTSIPSRKPKLTSLRSDKPQETEPEVDSRHIMAEVFSGAPKTVDDNDYGTWLIAAIGLLAALFAAIWLWL